MTTLDQNFLLINKPAGWTSFDVVNFVRKKILKGDGIASSPPKAGPRNDKLRVGHAGTLDPFATGLLIVAVGREATKRLDEFKALAKTYVATIKLGEVSDTDDSTGEISNYQRLVIPSAGSGQALSEAKDPLNYGREEILRFTQNDSIEMIESVLKQFIGNQLQIPPMYSAKQVNGQRLYKLARAGKTVERQPCEIEIYDIKLVDYTWPYLKIEVSCSAGTYIRTLARDIGERLGVGGYCAELTRTKIGEFSINQAVYWYHTSDTLRKVWADGYGGSLKTALFI